VRAILEAAGLAVEHFAGVIPNPTTDVIAEGSRLSRAHAADVVVGLGGGSSMDAAKAIAVEATHGGSCWDYLWFRERQPTEATLPVIAVTTTSGTGSQVTQVAVVTNPAERCKSAIYHPRAFPRVGIVDPELMETLPPRATALTGFDAFTHAFESAIHVGTSPYVRLMAWEAIELVARHLARAVEEGAPAARDALAWADTLAGMCIANAGVTLPHGMGMAIGGMYPHVAHGESLGVTYPAFARYTCDAAPEPFARLARTLDPQLAGLPDDKAARCSAGAVEGLLERIGLELSLRGLGVPEQELDALAEACLVLPDYQNNPRVATLDDVKAILHESYEPRG
jgi:alcohol dehydrogenase class IV